MNQIGATAATVPEIFGATSKWRKMLQNSDRDDAQPVHAGGVEIEECAPMVQSLAASARRIWTPHRDCERIVDAICEIAGTGRRNVEWSRLPRTPTVELSLLTQYVRTVCGLSALNEQIVVTEEAQTRQTLFRVRRRGGEFVRAIPRDANLEFGDQLFDAIDLIQLRYFGAEESSVDRFVRAHALKMVLVAQAVKDMDGGVLRSAPIANCFANKETALLAALFSSLRDCVDIDFDLVVNMEKMSTRVWHDILARRFGSFVDVVDSGALIRSFPGLAISCAAFAKTLTPGIPASFWQERISPLPDLLAAITIDPLSNDERTDIPSRSPSIHVRLARVGATATKIPVRLGANSNYSTHTVEAMLTCSLTGNQRGVHMSRFQQILVDATSHIWQDLPQLARALAVRAKERQGAFSAEATVRTTTFFQGRAPTSGVPSLQPGEWSAFAKSEEATDIWGIGLKLGVMTACPCTLSYSRLATERALRGTFPMSVGNLTAVILPTCTHSQPGHAELTITSSSDKLPSLVEMYDAINSVAHLVQSVLKRPDEHELVMRAHEQPQFCEDVARAIAVAAAAVCARDDIVDVVVELDESIHPHRAFAQISMAAFELWQNSKSPDHPDGVHQMVAEPLDRQAVEDGCSKVDIKS